MALHSTIAQAINTALLKVFSRVRLLRDILTDQGMTFMSQLVQVWSLLRIHSVRLSVYHLHPDRLVERFNHMLKEMLQNFVSVKAWNWDKMLPYLFAIRKMLQPSMCFSPFELLYGRQPWGILAACRRHGGNWVAQSLM